MITNPKLALPGPTWAPFRGWSVLFDPGASVGRRSAGMQRLAIGQQELSQHSVYRPLGDWSGELATAFGSAIAVLPPATYHVTLCDGFAQDHVNATRGKQASRFAGLLDSLPASLLAWEETLGFAADELRTLLNAASATVTFGVTAVETRGHAVVAALAAGDDCRPALGSIQSARTAALERIAAEVGLALSEPWTPHVTLGYWADRADGRRFARRLSEHAAKLVAELRGAELSFSGASLYGFLDMVTYWRVPHAVSDGRCSGVP